MKTVEFLHLSGQYSCVFLEGNASRLLSLFYTLLWKNKRPQLPMTNTFSWETCNRIPRSLKDETLPRVKFSGIGSLFLEIDCWDKETVKCWSLTDADCTAWSAFPPQQVETSSAHVSPRTAAVTHHCCHLHPHQQLTKVKKKESFFRVYVHSFLHSLVGLVECKRDWRWGFGNNVVKLGWSQRK